MYDLKMESEEEYEAEKSKPVPAESASSDDDDERSNAKKMKSSDCSPPASNEFVRINTHFGLSIFLLGFASLVIGF